MATRKKRSNHKPAREEIRDIDRPKWHADVHPEIKKTVLAIIFFVAAGIFVLSFTGKSGAAGGFIFTLFDFLLGKGYFFAPLMLVILGCSLIASGEKRVVGSMMLGGAIFLVASLANLDILFGTRTGGFIGMIIGSPLTGLFDFWASLLVVNALFAISVLLLLNMPFWRRGEKEEEEELDPAEAASAGVKTVLENINSTIKTAFEKKDGGTDAGPDIKLSSASDGSTKEKDDALIAVRKIIKKSDYKKPPLELLQGDRGKPSSGDIKANANIIKRTLENFGIDVEMGEVSIGPTVTQYTLRPAEGVKLARITALHNDLSLALAAHPIRIEAPVPGKSLVGIEVPNRSIALVGLRALLEHPSFAETSQPLLFALGRDVTGAPVFADLAKMPHLLISGSTGSGKSVSIHSIMSSFLYRNPPELLRFIIVDPKRVELSIYNDIPHLLTPVITEAKQTVQALRWATKEMDRRYDLLSTRHCRDIAGFNAAMASQSRRDNDADGGPESLPYIVIIIDELADIMMSFPREVESSIIRLAQMARAVGIHLLVATQRPSVEVITGLIKANITSRMAFQVASQIDSRTVLDASGAEKLLGNGDMLFLSGDMGKPRRIQGAYVSEQEVKRIIDFLREESAAPEFNEGILEMKLEEEDKRAGADISDEDPLYEQAQDLVMQAGKASASYLQRRLRVGYARAARLLDLLEQNGVIGPGEGAKPREVLMKSGQTPDGNSFEA